MSEPVTYDHSEIDHDYEGMLVPCRECGERVYLRMVPGYGCFNCDATARDVTIRAKE